MVNIHVFLEDYIISWNYLEVVTELLYVQVISYLLFPLYMLIWAQCVGGVGGVYSLTCDGQ